MAGKRVLLVDDEQDFTDVLAMRMQTRGLDVHVSDNGEDALKMASENFYDAVILDLRMPGMDGIETLRRMLRNNPDLQVILLTGHATIEKGIEAVKSGAMEFLEKPVDIEELLDKITQASVQRMELTEQRMEESLKKIMKRKGW